MSASAGRAASAARRVAAASATHLPWLVDGYRVARNPRWALDLRRDLEATRRSANFLRSLPSLDASAPVALLALYRDNVFDTKVGLVLASSLRLQGLRPVVSIPTNRAHRIRRYASAYGIEQVVAQDLLALSPVDSAECTSVRAEFLAAPIDFETIKAWRFRGQAIGNHVLSTLIRTTFDGSPDLLLDDNRDRLSAILDEVLLNTVRAEYLMAEFDPRLVLVEEANYSTNGPLVDVAVSREVDVIQTINIWRDDALMSKRLTTATRRVDAKSVAPETLAALEKEEWTATDGTELDEDFTARYGGAWELGRQFQPDTETRTADQIIEEVGLDPEKPTAVIFAHVLWDASLFFGVDLFENYADWLVQAVRAATENPHVNWVVKAHPSNVYRTRHGDVSGESSEVVLIRDNFPALPEHVRILLPETKISTLSLYQFADYGVTVRGTPGMEIACFGKPAFTAGTGTYAGLGFTYDSSTTAEFLTRLASIHEYGRLPAEMTLIARRYAHTLFTRRPWPTRSFSLEFDIPDEGWHPLDRNVRLVAKSVAEMEHIGDLHEWSAWALDSTDIDYVPTLPAQAVNSRRAGLRHSG